jgi:predicted dehydrogenase
MTEVRLGIVGVGGMGSHHARCVQGGNVPRLRLTAVCDVDPKALAKCADPVRRYADSRELIRSGEVDAVLVATPHYDHTTVGIDALGRGLHLLVEKPISVHKADAERLIAAWKGNGQVFAAMFNQRTDPYYQRVRRLVQGGELGALQRVSWIVTNWFRTQCYYDSGGWRATWKGEGGGVLLNQCPHNLDLLQWIAGMPVRVRAFCGLGKRHAIEVEDEVTAYFEYANGATGVFITGTGEAPGCNRLEICGDRGALVLEEGSLRFTRNETPAAEFLRTSKQGFARPPVWQVAFPPEKDSGTQHTGILLNFTEAILDGAPLLAPASDGLRSVEFANAMLLSSMTGQTVELPMDGAAYERQLQKLVAESRFAKAAATGASADLSGTFNTSKA